ncbi:MAG: ATP-binding protein [Candidatus Auribacter fodinae]|jgi:SpoVK/Ycf46/Vps4 family AAA+-type ATPase|uniref:ATP-binding protein n=1 Tax=Candidatus Auribacter fodinae TaxID=2093366 RepID=A0A3A4R2W2_9BACT|nr:MAG: ATP-binding protein [Candidatus Auribacter fodinae]
MATADQLRTLIRSHFSDNSERFYTIALQVAAHEARQGHTALANDIREIVDKERQKHRVIPFPQDLHGLVLTENPDTKKSVLVMEPDLYDRIERVIHEYRQQHKLKSHGLKHRRKILLIGSPGTGKTMTARVLAHELRLPLHTIQVDRLVTKFMGETSAKLRQIFDLIQQEHGVYLFDEFDAIGGERSLENDVGEMRRVLNAFLQFIEQDSSDSLIVAATNNPKLLDNALFRRFDDVLFYKLPNPENRKRLIENILNIFLASRPSWKKILSESEGLSHAEIDYACRDAIKNAILNDKMKVDTSMLTLMLQERQSVHHGRKQ